jgi:hypothetical protein
MRATLVAPPTTQAIATNQIGLPFAVVATPFAAVEAR